MSLLHSRREALSSYMFFFLMVPKFIVLLQKYLEELNPRNLLENKHICLSLAEYSFI